MCAPLGVDPLQASKKSFWSQLLGMGDFYHELAVKVAEVSNGTNLGELTGNIMARPFSHEQLQHPYDMVHL